MTVTIDKASGFLQLIKKDARMKRLNAMREEGVYAIDAKSLINELEALHNAKSIRRIKSDKLVAGLNTNLDYVLEDFVKLERKLDTVIKISDEVIKDLDQAYWTTKSLIDVAQLSARRPEI